MQLLKRLFNFYVFSNIHVALGVFCFVKLTLWSYKINENRTALFVFFSTIVSYNFIRFMNVPKTKNWFSNWFLKNKRILMVGSVFSGLICLYFLSGFRLKVLLVLSPFVLLTLFYGIQLPKMAISLRRIPGLKIFMIAFCFAGITVIFPLVQNDILIAHPVWMLFLQRMFFVVLITIPFDIRDVEFDNRNLNTIPQYFGIYKAKAIGLFMGLLVVSLEYIYLFKNFHESIVVLAICSLSVIILLFSSKNQSRYYSAFWVESLPILWLLLLNLSSA